MGTSTAYASSNEGSELSAEAEQRRAQSRAEQRRVHSRGEPRAEASPELRSSMASNMASSGDRSDIRDLTTASTAKTKLSVGRRRQRSKMNSHKGFGGF